ncbi:FAD-binding oxidoreductase [Rhizobium sp. TH2]|uniref:NAD(P)/FAD-dependent oxidoreductase n=1 Tax=Rhizobium sp. TH2 TaxID=2775403 RepID=UPI002157190B|nr:FAD-binding oxidoreductase [Rhizobium sp. TH2]UVC08760.1 FAD-binding oxidoreductase [Rhizobium sp. TH2]
MQATHPIIVAGAGLAGVGIARELAVRGERVILLDKGEPGRGTSFGNMASIAVNGFDAASRPSTWKKLPFWMVNPQAPVTADPLYAVKMFPWFLRFLAAGRPRRIREIEDAGASLATRALGDIRNLLGQMAAPDLLSEATCLQLYETEKAFQDGRDNLELMDRYGLKYEVLAGAALREREPLLNPDILKAVLLPQNHFITDPFRYVSAIVADMQKHGGESLTGELARVERDERGVTAVILKDGRRIETDRVVIAMGMQTADISKALHEPIPLETERGYHTQIMAPGGASGLRYSLIWPERAFMVTPTAGGIRVGGSVEMAGLTRAPNWRRARILVEHAKFALPSLNVENTTEWMGHRPATPDTVPVLSASVTTKGLYYSTGHGHLGLTYSATTGMLMADMIMGRTPPVDMTPFRIDRF